MWCSHCQHEVPAVARSTAGPLYCSLCEGEIVDSPEAEERYSKPSDAGVELDAFDAARKQAKLDLAPPIDFLQREQAQEKLRHLGRQLGVAFRDCAPLGSAIGPSPSWSPPNASRSVLPPEPQLKAIARDSAQRSLNSKSPTGRSWLVSLLLTVGVAGFLVGTALLAWSSTFGLPKLWQWGMTATIGAEGALILGLLWLATRLWRNSRRVNRQLQGVDQQLCEVHHLTGSLVGSRLSSSQHYYDHFSQGASPHLLVANLRGQIDQLAMRIAAEQ